MGLPTTVPNKNSDINENSACLGSFQLKGIVLGEMFFMENNNKFSC
jgi:hypothetical protein